MDAITFFFLLWFIPFTISSIITWFLKKRNRNIWPFTTLLIVLNVSLIFSSQNLIVITKWLYHLTGHYNAEAVAFHLLFAILICSGLLAGTGLGYFLWLWKQKQHSKQRST